jgi:hypothetical protein
MQLQRKLRISSRLENETRDEAVDIDYSVFDVGLLLPLEIPQFDKTSFTTLSTILYCHRNAHNAYLQYLSFILQWECSA